ncbi:transmembrane protein 60-like [Amblyraja radiata]|uniref:transmembrane protein 60-like n=1 Tax=Amblyraja radiata TaxID=386614 RepID=UPI0014036158|nr:transmembrane protein 60-like [Amblyraja radiata]XP_032872632.1 transmembrane protein 60-like [Amblyraja radiata]XP_032872634.1 transmembrane protein 60-like [Amblyraja radiata]XP_032872635.1 transmembrane protein 60-like [Amblyraja radiata]XP_055487201.1 transmembrane protein 60-like [Leucoraja erinacea]
MSLAQRVLLTWLLGLLFLIVLVLKMEETLGWSWFLVFVPLWLLDAALLALLLARLAGRCKAAAAGAGAEAQAERAGLRRRALGLCALLLQLAFLLALAARLQRLAELPLCWVLAPLWLLLLGAIVEVARRTFGSRPE